MASSNLSILYNKPVLVSESRLSGRRGAMFPIEILSIIFYMAIEAYSQHRISDMEPVLLEEARTIRAASQVCRLWRNVSFNCHRIWGTILKVDSSSTFWIRELLRRSGSAPLTIKSTSTPTDRISLESPKWKLLLTQIHRFRTLDITLGTHDVQALLWIFRQPAPLLESFTLKYAQKTGRCRSVDANISLPGGLFAGVAPKLRTLTLERVVFRWFPTDQVAQNIVRLDLSLTMDMASFSFDCRPTTMAFPKLQELVVTGTGGCASFLSMLAIPSNCVTTLSFTQYDYNAPIAEDPILWIEDYLLGWQYRQPPIHSWYLSTSQKGSFAFHAGTKKDPLNRPQFVLEYSGGHTTAKLRLLHLLEFLLGECVLLESASMTLDLQAGLYDSVELAETLADLLSQCSKLETLTLVGRSIDNVVPILANYPQAISNLHHLIIDGPYSASLSSVLGVKAHLRQVALQPVKFGRAKLQKITVCIDDSRKYKCLQKGISDLATVVNYVPLRPRVVLRGELAPSGWWSLGP